MELSDIYQKAEKFFNNNKNIIPIAVTTVLAFTGLSTFNELSKRDNVFTYIENELKEKKSLYYELSNGRDNIYIELAEELKTMEGLISQDKKYSDLLAKLKSYPTQEALITCIEQLKDAHKNITLLILNGASKKEHIITGFSSDVACRDTVGKKDISDNPINSETTYFLSVALIFLASILGAMLNYIRQDISNTKENPHNSSFNAFANGLGVGVVAVLVVSWGGWSFASIETSVVSGKYLQGVALVVLIGFLGGLFYHDFYEYLRDKAEKAKNHGKGKKIEKVGNDTI